MKSTVRILKHFIGATMFISAFLVFFNFLLLGLMVFKGMNEGQSPSAVVENVAENLQFSSNRYSLDSSAATLLKQQRAWAMLIDDAGQVKWDYMLPNELPKNYTLTDIAKFTKNYLMDYPVFVWEHDQGLLVVGYPRESIAKYEYTLSVNWVSLLPSSIVALILINIGLALFLSLVIGYKLVHSIRPLTQGIQFLSEDKETFIQPKGILADLAQSVNRASTLLQKKNKSLKSRDEARSNWIAGISHDIRTPLSMVLGYASDLEESFYISEEQRRQAGIIRQQGEKLRSLVNDLNLVSMLEYEMQPLNKKPMRLSVLVRQIATEFLNNGLDDRFIIEIDISDERVQVNGDERLLARAITNLIQNSINHNPDGCLIKLQTTTNAKNNSCSFILVDNGKGISQNELPNLLELPYSTKRKHPSQNGHGLGLPMVDRIAKAHQGVLLLSSDIEKGFRAEIVLPYIYMN